MAFCLPGRFLSCLVAVGSTGGILKSACKNFLGCAESCFSRLELVVPLVQQGMLLD